MKYYAGKSYYGNKYTSEVVQEAKQTSTNDNRYRTIAIVYTRYSIA